MRHRTIVLLLRIFAVLLPLLGALPAAAQEVTLTGWFNLVWEDPLQGPAEDRQRFFLVDDRGRTFELALDAADLRSAGGALALDRKRVSVTARETALRGEGTPVLDVVSIRAQEAALRTGGAAPPQSGAKPYVTILCRFADSTAVIPKSTYDAWMGSSYPGLDHYWRELSESRINTAGSTVVGWLTLPQPYSYYVTSSNVDLQKALTDCVAAADPTVDFTQYAGINMQFNTRFEYSWGGSRTLTLDGQTKTYGTTWLANWAGQSVYAHEMGHAFGLPHSSGPYTATYDSRWDVMSNSYVFHDGAYSSYVGQHTIAYHKDLLGWVPAARKYTAAPGTTQTITLERSALPGGSGYLMAQLPIPGSTAYYTVEARRNGVGYDRGLPGHAVVLHRVSGTARVVDPDGNGNPNDAGAMWLPGETFTDAAAGISVTVVSATDTGYQVTLSTQAAGAPVSITSAATRPDGRVGLTYFDQLVATGGAGVYSWTVTGGALPPGVFLTAAEGQLIGGPTAPGTFTYTATVTSGGTTASRAFTFNVLPRIVISSDATRPSGTVGTPYADQLQATAATGTVAWSHTGGTLPPGLTFNAANAAIGGTPTSAGSYTFTVTAANGGTSVEKAFTLTVYAPLAITSDSLRPTAAVDRPYSDTLRATGGTGSYAWSVTGGALPAGVTLSASTGALTGTPTVVGTYRFTATVVSGPFTGAMGFVLTVSAEAGIVSEPVRPAGVVGSPYTDRLQAVGGSGSFAWAVTAGALPSGLALDAGTGTVTGTPAAAGTFVYTLTATQGALTASRRFTTVVYAPLVIASDSVRAGGVVGAAYTDRLQAVGGTGSYGWAVTAGALPAGISLDATGALAGTPAEAGTFRFTATATSATLTGSGRFVLTVHRPVSIVSDTLRRAGVMGRAYADTLVAQGGSGAAAWRLSAGALPAGVTLEPSGALSGVPAESGTFRFAAAATTGTLMADRTFTLTVTRPTLQPGAVIDQLLGTGTLTAEEARYLDLQGNRNGRVDLGDVRAWMQATGTVLPVKIPGLEDAVPPRPEIDDQTREMER